MARSSETKSGANRSNSYLQFLGNLTGGWLRILHHIRRFENGIRHQAWLCLQTQNSFMEEVSRGFAGEAVQATLCRRGFAGDALQATLCRRRFAGRALQAGL